MFGGQFNLPQDSAQEPGANGLAGVDRNNSRAPVSVSDVEAGALKRPNKVLCFEAGQTRHRVTRWIPTSSTDSLGLPSTSMQR